MSYVENKQMLLDMIVYMAAVLPDQFPEFLSDSSIETEFKMLEEAIDHIHKKLGKEISEKCLLLAQAAREAYNMGDNERGEDLLLEMEDVITGSKSIRLRDLDPDTLARVLAGGKL